MNLSWQLAARLGFACLCSSCASRLPEEHLVSQRIPIGIVNGKPVTVVIRARSPGGKSEVGIRCSPDVWSALTNGTSSIAVRLLSSNKRGIYVEGIPQGHDAQCPIKSFY